MEQNERHAGASESSTAVRPDGPWTVRRLLAWMVPFLEQRGVDSPRKIAEILISTVLATERLRLYMEPDREPSAEELARLRELVARAGRHEPVQYLVGAWSFLGRDFRVAPCTLIPRPATEALVEEALRWSRSRGGQAPVVLDLCTGTGCIAVSLALGLRAIVRPEGTGCRPIRGSAAMEVAQLPVIEAESGRMVTVPATGEPAASAIVVVATDIVEDAVSLARENAARLGASIDARCGDLWDAVRPEERFDLIVANPPYVTDREYAELDRNVKEYEPASALRGGADGLDFVRRIVSGAHARLRSGGLLLVEIGWKHGDAAKALVADGSWCEVAVLPDCEGIDRVLRAVRA